MSLNSHSVECPYCGETIEIDVEWFGVAQTYIEDCQVCCRPIQFTITAGDEEPDIHAVRSD